MEDSISFAISYENFLKLMELKGHEIKQKNGETFLKPMGEKRFIRLTDISGYYTKEAIETRIEKVIRHEISRSENRTPRIIRCRKNYRKYIPPMPYQKPYSRMWRYKGETAKFEKLQSQYMYLCKHSIQSAEELKDRKEDISIRMEILDEKRHQIYIRRYPYKSALVLLHAKAGNTQDYVREAVEQEIYGRDKNYTENISDLCRYHDSQNPEHIYDITKSVIQSAQYMAAVRIRAEPPPASTLLPVLATAPKLMVYGLCNTVLTVAGKVLMEIEKVFEKRRERTDAREEKRMCVPDLRHQPDRNADIPKRQDNGTHKRTENAGYEQLSLSFNGGYAFYDCGRA